MQLMLKNVQVAFPNLFHAKEYTPGDGRPRWSATFVIVPGSANDKAIAAAITAEAASVLGAKAPILLKTMIGQSNKYCYVDGGTKVQDYFQGKMVLTSHRSAKMARPMVMKKDMSTSAAEDDLFYAGCIVNARVEIYCQAGENAGVRCSFTAIQFAGDAEPFSSSTPTSEGFADVSEGADAEDLM